MKTVNVGTLSPSVCLLVVSWIKLCCPKVQIFYIIGKIKCIYSLILSKYAHNETVISSY